MTPRERARKRGTMFYQDKAHPCIHGHTHERGKTRRYTKTGTCVTCNSVWARLQGQRHGKVMGTMRLTEPADVAAIAGAGEVTPEAQLFEIFARSARVYRQRTGGGDGSDGDSLFEPGPVFGSGRRVERMGGLLKG